MSRIKLIIASVFFCTMLNMTAFAGEWKQDSTGWQYQNDDGSYTLNAWQWIDGDHDGIAQCYYFGADGYCLMDTVTPDNCTVNSTGAYVVDDIVQTKTVAQNTAADTSQTSETQNVDTNVWIPATGNKYHSIPNCGRMNPDKAVQLSLSDALAKGYTECSKCH